MSTFPLFGQGVITTVAGSDWIFPGNNRPAVSAPLGRVVNVAVDRLGAVYIADVDNFMVFRVRPDGILQGIAGNGIRGYSGDGQQAVEASLQLPRGLAFDAAGNLYISDFDRARVRKVTPEGVISTVAGNGRPGFSGDGGPAVGASLDGPIGLAVDSAGNLYIADSRNHRIRRVTPDGVITTMAGRGTAGFAGDNGPAAEALLNSPAGIAFDPAGNLVVADTWNHRIRRITPSGVITTVAGTGTAAFAGDGALATAASLNRPFGVTVDSSGRILVADAANHRVRAISPAGIITTVAGDGRFEFAGDGGAATRAAINFPEGVAVDSSGNLYIADYDNARVRRVSPDGIISTFAGNGTFRLSADNQPATSATLHIPSGIVLDPAGNLYIAENQRPRVRKVAPDGTITTVAGDGRKGFSGESVRATTSSLFSPSRLALDSSGNLYISDNALHRIRRVTPEGIIRTVVGTGVAGFSGDGGPATQAALNQPEGIAVDGAGNLYIADMLNNRVRKVSPAGSITTLAGNGQPGSGGDGGPAVEASLNWPVGVAVDARGAVYIAERLGHRIRRVSANGVITTVAGNGQAGTYGDGGPATQASLNQPAGVLPLADGSILITELFGATVRRVAPDGTITTIAGNGVTGLAGDGGPATSAQLNIPTDVRVDARGNIYIADAFNNRVRVVLAAPPSFQANPQALRFTANSEGARTAEQFAQLSSTIPGLGFTLEGGVPSWLTVSPAQGVMPSVLRVSANPAQLAPGSYQTAITIRAPFASPPVRSVQVELVVEGAQPPRLEVEPNGISFSLLQDTAPALRQLSVLNRGGGSVESSIRTETQSGGQWLSASSSGGRIDPNSPLVLNVRADPSGLAAGTYSGAVMIGSSTGGDRQLRVPVTLSVARSRPNLFFSQSGLTFTAVAGGPTVPSQQVAVLNLGSGVMNWTAQASVFSTGPNWLRVNRSSGQSTAASLRVPFLDIGVDHTGLAPGQYYGQVLVSAANTDNSPQIVCVVLQVLPAGSNPGPLIRPTGLVFTTTSADPTPGSQSVQISNLINRSVNYLSGRIPQDPNNWFVHLPPEGTIAPNNPLRIVVQPSLRQAAPGIRRGTLTFQFDDGTPAQSVNLLLVVVDQASGTAASRQASGDCTPRSLLPVFVTLPPNRTALAGWPTPLELRVVDDCGKPLVNGSVSVGFSNGDEQLPLVHVSDGRWSGTWYSRIIAPQVVLTASAEDRATGIQGMVQSTVGVQSNPDPPVVAEGGIVNAAGGKSFVPIAPGGLISIFGQRLAEGTEAANQFPLSRQLQGTQVFLAGRFLPLTFVSDKQVNAVVPFDIPPNASHQLVVRRGRSATVPSMIPVASAEPALFSKDQTGSGQGLVFGVNEDGTSFLAEPGSAVERGRAVVVYCAGLGPVDVPLAEDQAAPGSPLARTTMPVSLFIGGKEAAILFSGLTPGFMGLYQVNAVVPDDVEAGDQVPVRINVAGRTSNEVTIAVR